ncbi:hypothetical protein ES705_24373 [subsurface metagenome]
MRPENLSYEDINVVTVNATDVADINTSVIPVPGPQFINPYKALLLIEARITVLAHELSSGELIRDVCYSQYWDFRMAGNPGLQVPALNNRVFVECLTGRSETFPLMRRIPAGEAWAIIPLMGSFMCGYTPPLPWVALMSLSVFYALTD